MTIYRRTLQTVAAAALVLTAAGMPAVAAEKSKRPPLQVEQAPTGEPMAVQEGEASYYGPGFHGRKTASGERFDQNAPTAASRDLPLGTRATVQNLENGREVEVRINDRGPYAQGRIIDLSKGAAQQLGMTKDGEAQVRVEAKPSDQPTAKARQEVAETIQETAPGCAPAQPGQRAVGC
ncbi:MAG TPA: septal ring lytic transglycosylase RlpA family protein [Alphaproteobacteria bacterium]|nr:septal ring lytic transglycosylase RlpA family protein [Alphaproteobacteria bacterium]